MLYSMTLAVLKCFIRWPWQCWNALFGVRGNSEMLYSVTLAVLKCFIRCPWQFWNALFGDPGSAEMLYSVSVAILKCFIRWPWQCWNALFGVRGNSEMLYSVTLAVLKCLTRYLRQLLGKQANHKKNYYKDEVNNQNIVNGASTESARTPRRLRDKFRGLVTDSAASFRDIQPAIYVHGKAFRRSRC